MRNFDPTNLHTTNDALELIAQYTPASDRRRATVIAALADIKARELSAMDAAREACRVPDARREGSGEVCDG